MTIPPAFMEAFASYRRMLAGARDDANKLRVIEECAFQIGQKWLLHGLERPDAVDEINDMAVCHGLGDTLGNDRLTAVIGAALLRGEADREMVPPLIEDEQQTNGHDKDTTKQYRYRLVPFADLKPGLASPYLITGVIPLNGLVAVWGPPKCGKSFWIFDLVMHIALGWRYCGRRVRQGPVCYLAFEGAEGFKARAEAFRRTHEIKNPDVPFYLLASNAKLVRDHNALIESIRGQMQAPPAAVVLDTLNRSIDGSESKDEDMGAYLAAAETIREQFTCVVIIVHHCGVDGTRPRGHTSLTGTADVQIAVKRDTANNVVAEIEYMKDGPEGATFTSALKVVELGTDDEGNPIASCTVEQVDGAAQAPVAAKVVGAARIALDLLCQAIIDDDGQQITNSHIPPNTRTTSLVRWRSYCEAGTVSESDNPDNRRRAFVRISKTLQSRGIIGCWEQRVWVAGQAGQSPDRMDFD